jgi:hypothetical protein
MTEKLLPCPLCKKRPGEKVGPPALVRCVTEGCAGKALGAETPTEWNTRVGVATPTPMPSDAMPDERGPLAWTISPKTEAAIKEIDGNLRSARLRASDLVAGAATPTPTQDYDAERNRIARIICPDGLGSGDPMETAYWKDALSYADLILATRPSPAAVDAWQDIAQEARFLLDRLEELDDANDAEYIREFEGHVRPPMSRLRRLLPRHDCEESQS